MRLPLVPKDRYAVDLSHAIREVSHIDFHTIAGPAKQDSGQLVGMIEVANLDGGRIHFHVKWQAVRKVDTRLDDAVYGP